MSPEVQKYCSRAIVRYLDGDMALFNFYVGQAANIYERQSRLYVTIEDILDNNTKAKLKSIK